MIEASLYNRISRLLLHVSDTVDMNSLWNALTCDYFPIRKQSKWNQGRLSTSVSNAPTRVAQWEPKHNRNRPRSQGSSTSTTNFWNKFYFCFWILPCFSILAQGPWFRSRKCRSDEPCSEQPELGLCYETLLTTDEQCGKSLANPVTMEQCCSTVLVISLLWFLFDFGLIFNLSLTIY